MKFLLHSFISITFTLVLLCSAKCQNDSKQWLDLLNDENITKWTPKIRGYPAGENFGNTFHLDQGILKVDYSQYQSFENKFGHVFYQIPYSHYHLKFEYRFTGEQVPGGPGWAFRNSGIMLHCQSPESMGLNQDFPISLEAQLLGGDGQNDRTTMNLCTPGTHVEIDGELETRHCISSSSQTYHGDQWVKAEVLVLGDSIINHIVDGEIVISYENPTVGGANVSGLRPEVTLDTRPLKSGYISFQSESHPVEFRNVHLMDLAGE